MAESLGPVFQVKLPNFNPVVLRGPEAARQVLVSERKKFHWRNENDPVTKLLRQGLLVVDGQAHDQLRSYLQPYLNRSQVRDYIPMMLAYTDQVMMTWGDESVQDMQVEMRRLTLLILIGTLFGVDAMPDLDRLWQPILKVLKFISPGMWLVSPGLPRPGYQSAIEELDEYLYSIIHTRRRNPGTGEDMLSSLVGQEGMTNDLIRDQLLTMLIAGHDTSTALLSWLFHVLGGHPKVMTRLRAEVEAVVGDQPPTRANLSRLRYMDQVIKETLRLYPPIHAGNRLAGEDLQIQDCPIPQGSRILFSIYLTQRDENHWVDGQQFDPERFDRKGHRKRPALSYLPFGAGPRNCIGAIFADVETKAVLARVMQTYYFATVPQRVVKHMGATLEPQPGVLVKVSRRR
jgi:cytochrome P450